VPAGSDQIIDYHNPLARLNRIVLKLDRVSAVLESIAMVDSWAWQLASFARHYEAAAERVGQRCGNEKSPRLDPDEKIRAERANRIGEPFHSAAPSARLREQRGDVVEQDPRLREIGDRPDVLLKIHCHRSLGRGLAMQRSVAGGTDR